MPYIVNYTNSEKTPITVFDNTTSTDTSLQFPGRNVTGYGKYIAENFLALLENFSNNTAPVNPVEGQLWFKSDEGILQLWDGTNWKAASNIQKSATEPSVENSKVGELWVDTTNQQLRIYTGTRWILVGPTESSIDGLRYGPVIERIADSDNIDRVVQIFYIADVPVIIFSKDSFTPKVGIDGFVQIKSGININTPSNADQRADFAGGLLPKVYATTTTADSLNVSGTAVEAGKFLRSDTTNTTDFSINIRNNNGITVGSDGTFNIATTATSAKIYNSAPGSSLDLQINRNGVPSTVLRIIDNKVGINKAAPDRELDIAGDIGLTGSLIISNTSDSTNLNNGSIRTAGGLAVSKNAIVGTTLEVQGTTTLTNLVPKSNLTYDIGTPTQQWKTLRAQKIIANEIEGVLNGNINGNANTATNLKNVTSFRLQGDVISQTIEFDGQVGSYTKIFNTSLTANIIKSKEEPFPGESKKTDYVLVYRASEETTTNSGLLKMTRDVFVGDLGVPIGTILPYAGSVAPTGYLLCDGSEVEIARYRDLYDIISTTYNTAVPLSGVGTFRVPDLRGRFPLGKDNMKNTENGNQIPLPGGSFGDGGGGNADRVQGTAADTLGGNAGNYQADIQLQNLPEHQHDMKNGSVEYAAIRVDTALNAPAVPGLGPTAPGQAQYLKSSGNVTKPNEAFVLGQPLGIMNPYLTLNYIIRSGPPLFTTTTT